MKKEASFYQKESDGKVVCNLCPHNCSIAPGAKGRCHVRINKDGVLYSLNYGKLTSLAMDPIEKKPLYHFYPGTQILSLGTFGCNFSCPFCQNWQLSQEQPSSREMTPKEVIELARRKKIKSIAYTYSEPMVWYEFVKECSQLAAKENIKNVLVTNGFIEEKPLKQLLPDIDAANVDLKSFNNKLYQKVGGEVEKVKENIKYMQESIHLEITTLVIPGLNDSYQEMENLFKWIAALDQGIPLHLSRYFPAYKFKETATPISTMDQLYKKADKILEHVYPGNLRVSDSRKDTFCPECGEKIISRQLFSARSKVKKGKCPECAHTIKGVFN